MRGGRPRSRRGTEAHRPPGRISHAESRCRRQLGHLIASPAVGALIGRHAAGESETPAYLAERQRCGRRGGERRCAPSGSSGDSESSRQPRQPSRESGRYMEASRCVSWRTCPPRGNNRSGRYGVQLMWVMSTSSPHSWGCSGAKQTPTYLSAARRSWGPSWRQQRPVQASRRRRGPVALRSRLSPGGLLSRCADTVGRRSGAFKQIPEWLNS